MPIAQVGRSKIIDVLEERSANAMGIVQESSPEAVGSQVLEEGLLFPQDGKNVRGAMRGVLQQVMGAFTQPAQESLRTRCGSNRFTMADHLDTPATFTHCPFQELFAAPRFHNAL